MIQLITDCIKIKSFLLFCRKFINLTKAGISHYQALTIITQDESNPRKKKLLREIKNHVDSGESFISGLQKLLPSFTPFSLYGDNVPNIENFLIEIQYYYHEKLNRFSFIKKKVGYPLLLLCSTLGILLLFIFFILPLYVSYFHNLNITAPPSILFLVNNVDNIKAHPVTSLLLLGIIGYLLYQILNPYITKSLQKLLFPVNSADLLWILGLCLQEGMSLKQTLLFINTDNKTQPKFQIFKQMVEKSGHFTQSMQDVFKLSQYHIELLRNAEQSNKFIETLFLVAADIREMENTKIENVSKIIPILIFLLLTCMILIFMYFIFLPIISGVNLFI